MRVHHCLENHAVCGQVLVRVGNHLIGGICSKKMLAEHAFHNLTETGDRKAISEHTDAEHTFLECFVSLRFAGG